MLYLIKGYLIVDYYLKKIIKSEGILLKEEVYVILHLLSE